MARTNFSPCDFEVAHQLSDGYSDVQVCSALGITSNQLTQSLARIAHTAANGTITENVVALCERALRRRADAKVRSLESRFFVLMQSSPDALLIANGRSGIIVSANERAAQLFGLERRDLIGIRIEALLPEALQSLHCAYRISFLASARRRGSGLHPPIEIRRPDGSSREIAVSLTAATDDEDVMVVCTECKSDTAKRNRALFAGATAD